MNLFQTFDKGVYSYSLIFFSAMVKYVQETKAKSHECLNENIFTIAKNRQPII